MKIERFTPLAIILAAAMLCGTILFIYQDFREGFDKYQLTQSKAYQDQLDVLQSQNETLKQEASALIDFDARQIAVDEQKKLQGSRIISSTDHTAEITTALNGIWDELNKANQLQFSGQLDSTINNQQSLDEMRKIRENQEQQQIMNIRK